MDGWQHQTPITKVTAYVHRWILLENTLKTDDIIAFSNFYDLMFQGDLCLQAMQSPGVLWTEITYKRTSSQDCSRLGLDFNTSNCLGTFVFVGDLIAMSHSVHLTAYQPRWLFNFFGKSFPNILERSLTCTFHVSLALVLLNSLPVSSTSNPTPNLIKISCLYDLNSICFC